MPKTTIRNFCLPKRGPSPEGAISKPEQDRDLEITKYTPRKPFSVEILLLGVLILPNLDSHFLGALAIGAAILYVIADTCMPISVQRITLFIKTALLLFIIVVLVLVPAFHEILVRPRGLPNQNLNDGAFQTELALRYLVNGKNPYVVSYRDTGMELYVLSDAPTNPAVENFVYLPFLLVVSLPIYWVSVGTLGWYDQRFVYLIAFIIVLIIIPQLVKEPQRKLMLLMAIALSSDTGMFLRNGFNDILVLAILLGAVLCYRHDRIGTASVLVGCACAIKPSAWFFVPFFSLLILNDLSIRENAIQWFKKMLGLGIAGAVCVIPFIVWDWSAFFRGTILYALGLTDGSMYPIRGYGFGSLLLSFGIVNSPLDKFPFWIFQLFVTLPTLGITLAYQRRHNKVDVALFGYAATFFISVFFSRFLQGNYLQFAVLLFLIAFFIDPSKLPTDVRPKWDVSRSNHPASADVQIW